MQDYDGTVITDFSPSINIGEKRECYKAVSKRRYLRKDEGFSIMHYQLPSFSPHHSHYSSYTCTFFCLHSLQFTCFWSIFSVGIFEILLRLLSFSIEGHLLNLRKVPMHVDLGTCACVAIVDIAKHTRYQHSILNALSAIYYRLFAASIHQQHHVMCQSWNKCESHTDKGFF